MTTNATRAAHWDHAYAAGDTTRSWYQPAPVMSLRMLDSVDITLDDAILDVGGGASTFTDALLQRGHTDVSVLDISAVALRYAQHRIGLRAQSVEWVQTDLLEWQPTRTYRVWHDRAVLHFLTADAERDRYLAVLAQATSTGSLAIVGCFAPDGPEYCSGLPVARYDTTQIDGLLGDQWRRVSDDREEHRTPAGATQPFSWVALTRR